MKTKHKEILSEAKVVKSMIQLEREMISLKESILKQLVIEGVDDPGILKCVFMAGGPGSGKSFVANEIFGVGKGLISVAASGLKIINSDAAFESALKKHGIDPKDLAKIEKENPELWDKIAGSGDSIRNRAKNLTNTQKSFYEAGRLGMIIDGTGHVPLPVTVTDHTAAQ